MVDAPEPSPQLLEVAMGLAREIAPSSDDSEKDASALDIMGAVTRLYELLKIPQTADMLANNANFAESLNNIVLLLQQADRELRSPQQDTRGRALLAETIDAEASHMRRLLQDWAQINVDYQTFDDVRAAIDANRAGAREAQVERQIRLLRDSSDEARAVVADVKTAAGQVADVELSVAFESYADAERAAANTFRLAAIVSLILAAIAAYVGSYGAPPSNAAQAIGHATAVVSVLAIFGYMAREAAQHRNAARWASVMVVQLRTFEAYTAPMGQLEREELRAFFGKRVFSELPTSGGKADDSVVSVPALDAIAAVLRAGRADKPNQPS